jgi:hypothetical protein
MHCMIDFGFFLVATCWTGCLHQICLDVEDNGDAGAGTGTGNGKS